jgi:hypothetical protein
LRLAFVIVNSLSLRREIDEAEGVGEEEEEEEEEELEEDGDEVEDEDVDEVTETDGEAFVSRYWSICAASSSRLKSLSRSDIE